MRIAVMIAITATWTTGNVESVRADDADMITPVTLRLDAGYHLATDGTQLGLVLGTVHFDVRHNYYLGDPFYEVTTGAGWASGVRTAHTIAARIGTGGLGSLLEFLFGDCLLTGGICHHQLMGISFGVALDGAGERIPEAWTIPIDGYVYVRTGEVTSLGPIGGVSWAFAGADRALGWRAGLDLIVTGVGSGNSLRDPRNFHISVEAQRLAGATFVGLTFGIENWNRYDRFFHSAE
jgi:hypothetical protein